MKIEHCVVKHLSFASGKGLYTATVGIYFKRDERLATDDYEGYSNSVDVAVRVIGEHSWSFDRIQDELVKEAAAILDAAHKHLNGATIASLIAYNAENETDLAVQEDN